MEVKKVHFLTKIMKIVVHLTDQKYIFCSQMAFLLLLASQKVYILLKYTPCMKNLAGKDSSFKSFKMCNVRRCLKLLRWMKNIQKYAGGQFLNSNHITLNVRRIQIRRFLDDILAARDGLVLRTRPSLAAYISSKILLIRILPYIKD